MSENIFPKNVPIIQANVTFLSDVRQGRINPTSGQYRPHIVVGPHSQDTAIMNSNVAMDRYLGVAFVAGPDIVRGESAEVTLSLIYFPEVNYDEVSPGVTFTIREGPYVVG